jgi:hypothetical protein
MITGTRILTLLFAAVAVPGLAACGDGGSRGWA